jgi:hypothetical protein
LAEEMSDMKLCQDMSSISLSSESWEVTVCDAGNLCKYAIMCHVIISNFMHCTSHSLVHHLLICVVTHFFIYCIVLQHIDCHHDALHFLSKAWQTHYFYHILTITDTDNCFGTHQTEENPFLKDCVESQDEWHWCKSMSKLERVDSDLVGR